MREQISRKSRFESLRLGASVVLVIVLPLIAFLAGAARPFFWTWLAAMALALFNIALAGSARVRSHGLVFFGVALSFCLAEASFAVYNRADPRDIASYTTTQSGRSYVNHSDMGYASSPGAKVAIRRARGQRTIFDVTYTINDQGARSTRGDPHGDTWLFMGCSLTFGYGVADDETLPSRFSAQLGHSANVVNVGFGGYGPHQMLRALEINRLGGVKSPVTHVVYQGMSSHVRRSAGRAIWDLNGPSYEISGRTVTYAGPFHTRGAGKFVQLLERSDLARFFLYRLYFNDDASQEDVEVYARIVERSAELARRKLGAGFTIVFWDADTDQARQVLARLEKTGLPLLRVSAYIPRSEWAGLTIPMDSHPSAEAYRRIAAGLATHFNSQRGAAASTP